MRSKLIIPATLATGLAIAACGGGGGGTGSHPAGRGPGRPVRTYHVKLSGKAINPPGAPKGSGAAVIALHHHDLVCFRFAHLHGFSGPTAAYLGRGTKGQQGKVVLHLSRSSVVHHKGCARASRALGASLERKPAGYFVAIVTKQYPKGAVGGQL